MSSGNDKTVFLFSLRVKSFPTTHHQAEPSSLLASRSTLWFEKGLDCSFQEIDIFLREVGEG